MCIRDRIIHALCPDNTGRLAGFGGDFCLVYEHGLIVTKNQPALRDFHQQQPHPDAGRSGLDLGPQGEDGPNPRVQDGRTGGGKLQSDGLWPADAGPNGRD